MNKTLKKIIAVLLSVIMILSVTSVSFAAEEEAEHEEHATMFSIASTFFWEIVEFFRYIFYGVWMGEPGPSEIPAAPTDIAATTLAA